MKTDMEKYKWGIFYFDPKDSRLIVPKVTRLLGWTFNFGHPLTYFIIVIFIALLVWVS